MPADHDSLYALIAETADERLANQLRFVLEIDRLKGIVRRTPPLDGSRNETDAGHTWHLATNGAWLATTAAMSTSWNGWPGQPSGRARGQGPAMTRSVGVRLRPRNAGGHDGEGDVAAIPKLDNELRCVSPATSAATNSIVMAGLDPAIHASIHGECPRSAKLPVASTLN
jgi:hypothetical protein